MKVGIFLGDYSPEAGGAYTFETEILQALVRLKQTTEHHFIIFGFTDHIPSVFQSLTIDYVPIYKDALAVFRSRLSDIFNAILRKLRNPHLNFKISLNQTRLLSQIIKHKVDCLWNLNPYFYLTADVPYITTVWDVEYRRQPFFPEVSREQEWDWREQLCTHLLRKAAYVITSTEVGKKAIHQCYQVPSDAIRVLPFPTPTFPSQSELIKAEDVHQKYNLSPTYLFYPAQFWPHKNHVGLLYALKILRDKYTRRLPLVFVGSDKGNLPHIKQVVAELDLADQVQILGFVPREDLAALYQNAFALTYASLLGPDNLPPLEAFALGCPVIATDLPGAHEQLGEAALLVDSSDAEAMAIAINTLWEDKALRQTLVERGKKRAAQWTVEDYVKGVFDILDEFAPIRRCWSNTSVWRQR